MMEKTKDPTKENLRRVTAERNKLRDELEKIREMIVDQNPIYNVLQSTLNMEEFELSYIKLNYTFERYIQMALCLKSLHIDLLRMCPDDIREGLTTDIDEFIDDAIVMRRFIERLKKEKHDKRSDKERY